MAGRWYRDSAKDNIDTKLALTGAGAGAKAFSSLARIPLDIDDRKMKQQALDSASSSANSRLSVAEINAKAKIEAARLGLKGKEVTAFSRQYVANAGRANNINNNATANAVEGSRSDTAKAERANKLEVQKVKNKGKKKSPTEKITYGGDGSKESRVVTKEYVPDPFENMTMQQLADSAKKIKKTHGNR